MSIKELSCIHKEMGSRRKFYRQALSKYLGIFYVLGYFPFTGSETEPDNYHQLLNVQVASRIAELLKT